MPPLAGSVVDGGALVLDRMMVPRRGTFTLIIPDSICVEVTESGRTIRLDFRPKTLRERAAPQPAQQWARSSLSARSYVVVLTRGHPSAPLFEPLPKFPLNALLHEQDLHGYSFSLTTGDILHLLFRSFPPSSSSWAPQRHTNSTREPNMSNPAQWEKMVAAAVSVLTFTLVGWLVVRNHPFADPNLVVVFRTVLSVAAAILGATIPGFLHLDWKTKGLVVRSGGALALFTITFAWAPSVIQPPLPLPIVNPPPKADPKIEFTRLQAAQLQEELKTVRHDIDVWEGALFKDEVEKLELLNQIQRYSQDNKEIMAEASRQNLQMLERVMKVRRLELEKSNRRRAEIEQLLVTLYR